MYEVEYEQGNGYRCSCCRQTSRIEKEFATEKELQDWLNQFEADRIHPEDDYFDSGDQYIVRIIANNRVTSKYKPNDEVVKAIVAKRVRKEQARKRHTKAQEVKKEKAKLKELAKKYPEVLKGDKQ